MCRRIRARDPNRGISKSLNAGGANSACHEGDWLAIDFRRLGRTRSGQVVGRDPCSSPLNALETRDQSTLTTTTERRSKRANLELIVPMSTHGIVRSDELGQRGSRAANQRSRMPVLAVILRAGEGSGGRSCSPRTELLANCLLLPRMTKSSPVEPSEPLFERSLRYGQRLQSDAFDTERR